MIYASIYVLQKIDHLRFYLRVIEVDWSKLHRVNMFNQTLIISTAIAGKQNPVPDWAPTDSTQHKRKKGGRDLPFEDIAERASPDQLEGAESGFDGRNQRRRIRHLKGQRLPPPSPQLNPYFPLLKSANLRQHEWHRAYLRRNRSNGRELRSLGLKGKGEILFFSFFLGFFLYLPLKFSIFLNLPPKSSYF